MKQFDLKEYLVNPSRKLVTRDGRNARIVCTNRRYAGYPIVALVQICDNYLNEEVYTYTKNGEFEAEQSTKWDLFFAPEKHEGYVNVYRGLKTGNFYCANVFESEELAKGAGKGSIATIKIEWEE